MAYCKQSATTVDERALADRGDGLAGRFGKRDHMAAGAKEKA